MSGRRASKPHDQNADAALNAPDKRVQQKVGEPVGGVLSSLCLLQLLPGSSESEGDSRHAGWSHVGAVGIVGSAGRVKVGSILTLWRSF